MLGGEANPSEIQQMGSSSWGKEMREAERKGGQDNHTDGAGNQEEEEHGDTCCFKAERYAPNPFSLLHSAEVVGIAEAIGLEIDKTVCSGGADELANPTSDDPVFTISKPANFSENIDYFGAAGSRFLDPLLSDKVPEGPT